MFYLFIHREQAMDEDGMCEQYGTNIYPRRLPTLQKLLLHRGSLQYTHKTSRFSISVLHAETIPKMDVPKITGLSRARIPAWAAYVTTSLWVQTM